MSQLVSWLTEFSYRRAWVIIAAIVLTAVAGFLTFTRINQELIPDFDFPIVTVVAQVPGGQPDDVVRDAVTPIEGVTADLPGLQSQTSTAIAGLGVVLLEFDFGVSVNDTEQAVRQRLADARLPATVATQILLFDPSVLPVLEFSVQGDLPETDLLDIAAGQLAPALRQLDGVGSVEVVGGQLRELLVTIDRTEMLERGITYDQVAAALAANNVIAPSGAIPDGDRIVPLETISVYTSVDDLRAVPLHAADGTTVALGTIATIDEVETATLGKSRTNGQPAVAMRVAKQKSANTVEVSHAVQDRLDELAPDLADGVTISVFTDQAEFIEESISGVIEEGVIGGVLAIVVVFLFLANWRTTLVTAVSIPLSLVAAIVVLDQVGETLNLMTLSGLTIAIGRVIDDSIVVLENVYRHMARGERGLTAIVRGAREVTIAIIGATATTCAVFLPLGLVGGLIGQLFLPFALAVVFALIASLLVAVTVIPMLARFTIEGHVTVDEEGSPATTRLGRIYTPALEWALRHRLATLGITSALAVGSIALVPFLSVVFLPDSGQAIITVNVDARPGQTQDSVLAQSVEVESLLDEVLDVEQTQTVITGASGDFTAIGNIITGRGANSATMSIELGDDAPSRQDSANLLRARLAEAMPDADNISVSASGGFAPPTGVSITVQATDPAAQPRMAEVADELVRQIRAVPDTANVKTDISRLQPAIQVDVDPTAADRAGLSPGEVAAQLRNLSANRAVTEVTLPEGPRTVRLLVSGADVSSPAALGRMPVAPGVTLDQIAELQEVEKQPSLTRIDGRPGATVTADVTGDNVGAVSADVQSIVDGLTLPDGIAVEIGGVTSDMEEGFANMLIAIGVSIVLVYGIMALLFRSWLDPLVILFTLPLAVIGAIIALFVTGSPISVSALIGMLMLVGIVVTNAIVMLEFVIMLREEEGYEMHRAVVEGAQTRLRPILMTAIAAMLALIPLSLGLTEGALIAADLGRVVIGGLFSSTLLTLLVVPVVYTLVDDFKNRLGLHEHAPHPHEPAPFA